jgi:hypothetical protein
LFGGGRASPLAYDKYREGPVAAVL